MRCELCNANANRLFMGKCNRCLCREAIDDALEEEIGGTDEEVALRVNNPITPYEYINTIKGLGMCDWKSFVR